MITLAVSAGQAEAVVFGIEHGTLWITLEPEGADVSGTDVVTSGTIYERAF
jgi:pilus assembly protein CpaB